MIFALNGGMVEQARGDSDKARSIVVRVLLLSPIGSLDMEHDDTMVEA